MLQSPAGSPTEFRRDSRDGDSAHRSTRTAARWRHRNGRIPVIPAVSGAYYATRLLFLRVRRGKQRIERATFLVDRRSPPQTDAGSSRLRFRTRRHRERDGIERILRKGKQRTYSFSNTFDGATPSTSSRDGTASDSRIHSPPVTGPGPVVPAVYGTIGEPLASRGEDTGRTVRRPSSAGRFASARLDLPSVLVDENGTRLVALMRSSHESTSRDRIEGERRESGRTSCSSGSSNRRLARSDTDTSRCAFTFYRSRREFRPLHFHTARR